MAGERIRMRVNKEGEQARCQICNADRENSLEMFDLAIGGQLIRICDLCNGQLFKKTLRATCYVDGKVKSQRDLRLMNKRRRGSSWGTE